MQENKSGFFSEHSEICLYLEPFKSNTAELKTSLYFRSRPQKFNVFGIIADNRVGLSLHATHF